MKKIMTVLLSVAVLVAFAACDGNATNPYFGAQVESVTLAYTPDYIAGETIDPDDVLIRIVYNNNTSKEITGTEAGLKGDYKTSASDVKDGVTFTFNYGSSNAMLGGTGEQLIQRSIVVPVYAINEVKVDVTNAASVVEIDKAGNISQDGLAFTVVYGNNSERAATADDLKVFGVTIETSTTDSMVVDKDVEIAVQAKISSDNVKTTVSDKWVATVVDNPALVVKSVALTQDESVDIFGAEEGVTNTTKLAEIPYTLTVTFNDDSTKTYSYKTETATLTQATDVTMADGSKIHVVFRYFKDNANYVIKSTDNDFVATVYYTPAGGKMQTKVAEPLHITYTTDYYTVYTPALADSSKTYDEGGEVKIGDFTFTASELASGKTGTKTETPSSISIDLDTDSVYYGAYAADSTDHKFEVKFVWSGRTGVTVSPIEVTVNDPNPASEE